MDVVKVFANTLVRFAQSVGVGIVAGKAMPFMMGLSPLIFFGGLIVWLGTGVWLLMQYRKRAMGLGILVGVPIGFALTMIMVITVLG